MEKATLEQINARKIEENRNLLDQLENLNNNVVESDSKIRSLEANLLSSMQTVRRLESGAARAADAERHLSMLEEEQEKLHSELRITREDARVHALRCKEAQRGILDLQDQLERLEKETVLERERHEETVRRIEKQREVDKQLDIAAGRLKGAAASKSLQDQGKGNSKIIGHFVKDLLQDNATLQLGIAELREMLMTSNDEVQNLRDQLQTHQPMHTIEDVASPASTLKAELEGLTDNDNDDAASTTRSVSQELHIHHHYHTPSKEVKRVRRKRTGLRAGSRTHSRTASGASTPRSSGAWTLPQSPSAPSLSAEHLSLTAKAHTVSQWNDQVQPNSEFSSSTPSSPILRATSVFDTTFTDIHDSVGSPATTFDPNSPAWQAAQHRRLGSVGSSRSFQSLSCFESDPELPHHRSGYVSRSHSGNAIAEEDETESQPDMPRSDGADPNESLDDLIMSSRTRPRLSRVPSHESIMSLTGGLDIHTLRIRPSQMTLRPLGGADAVITGVVAQPTLSRSTAKRSDAALRDNFLGMSSPRAVSSPITRATPSPGSGKAGALRSWAGWRPWGGSASKPVEGVEEEPAEAQPPVTPRKPADVEGMPTPVLKSPRSDKGKQLDRTPGINQSGAIPGFQQYWAAGKRKGAPAQVTTQVIDTDALNESLLG